MEAPFDRDQIRLRKLFLRESLQLRIYLLSFLPGKNVVNATVFVANACKPVAKKM